MRYAAIIALLAGVALAQTVVEVQVGATVRQDVGYARGVRCDDLSIINVEMSTDTNRNTNVLSITGLKAGRTLCRAGLELNQVSYLFDIVVTEPRSLPRR